MRNWRERQRRQRSRSVVTQFLIAGPVGLAAGALILWCLYPNHPMFRVFRSNVSSIEETPPSPVPPVSPPTGEPPEGTGGSGSDEPPPRGDHPGWSPPGAAGGKKLGPDPKPPPPITIIPPSPRPEPVRTKPDPPVASPGEQVKEMILEVVLEEKTRPAPLNEITDPSTACARIEFQDFPDSEFAEFDPTDGIVRKGRPLDILIKRYGTTIAFRVSMETVAGGTSLRVSTPVITGLDDVPRASFTQSWIQRQHNRIQPEAIRRESELEVLRATKQNIEIRLRQPLDSKTRGDLQMQLAALERTISGKQQVVDYAQKLKRLVELADELYSARLKCTVIPEGTSSDSPFE